MTSSDAYPLPESALAFVTLETPASSDMAPLSGLAPTTLSTLIAVLEERGLADHLQLLAGLGSATGVTRREARQALWRLRNRGIVPTPPARPATGAEGVARAREPLNLDALCLASPPGMFGRFWLLLGTLPGADALEVKGGHGGSIEEIDVLRGVSPSRVRRLAAEFARHQVRGRPVPVRAGTALRLIDAWSAALPHRPPPRWRAVEAWAEAARTAGATSAVSSARTSLGHLPDTLPVAALHALREGGIHLPAPDVIRSVLGRFQALVDAPPENPDDVDALAMRFGEGAVARWLDAPAQRERLKVWLEATADVMHDARAWEAARGFLGVADAIDAVDSGEAASRLPFVHAVLTALFQGEYADEVKADPAGRT